MVDISFLHVVSVVAGVKVSPHVHSLTAAALLLLGGFGNLPGYMDFWDKDNKKFKKLNSCMAHFPVQFGWSPCGCFFFTATCFPRLRVDNQCVGSACRAA